MKDDSSFKNIIRKLIANGCKRITDIHVKNVNYTVKDNYIMVLFTLSEPICTYQQKQDGSYGLDRTNILYTSLTAIVHTLLEDEYIGWMSNPLIHNPEYLNLILNGAQIDILQQEVPANTEYKNPFGNHNQESVVFDHNIIINHVLGFKLSQTGELMADKFVDKLLGG